MNFHNFLLFINSPNRPPNITAQKLSINFLNTIFLIFLLFSAYISPLLQQTQTTIKMQSQQHQQPLRPASQNTPSKTCFNRIRLNSDISYKNFIGCLVHYFMLSFIFVSVDSLQPMLLQQKFSIQKKDTIENFKNVIVISFDILVKILCAPIFGYLADRKGRKFINIYGVICIGITMMLMPYSFQFYIYVVLRCIYASGAIAISVVPLLADYVHPTSRGTCAAILVFMSSVGAVSSAFINFTILSSISIENKIYVQYGVISLLILLIGIIYTLLLLKAGNQYYLTGENRRRTTEQLIRIGKESLKHPQISTGYVAAFLARSDSILLSLYLVLWTYSFDKNDFDNSSSKASALSGITYTIIMLSCIIYGFLYEKNNINKRNLMVVMLIFAMVGSAFMNFSESINSFYTYTSLSLLGVGMSGLLTASLYLVNEYSTPEHRGYITGIQTFFGVIGIILQTVIGAVLYEFVYRGGPFAYFSFVCLVGIIFTMVIYRRRSPKTSNQLVQQRSAITTENQNIQ